MSGNISQDHIEKLSEKHQQTQGAIKNLQQIEQGLFKNLEEAKRSGKGGKAGQRELLSHISKLSAVRSNLFKDLKNEYNDSLSNQLGSGKKKSNESKLLKNNEKLLNQLKQNLGTAEEVRGNRKRMIEIGDYEYHRYEHHKNLMKVIAFTSLGLILFTYLLKKKTIPENVAKVGLVICGAIGIIFIIRQVIDMWFRNNMDYQKYDWGFWYGPGPPHEHKDRLKQPSIWETDKKFFQRIYWGAMHDSENAYKKAKDAVQEQADDIEKITGVAKKARKLGDELKGDVLGKDPYANENKIESYDKQVRALFNTKNCPEGALIRGYCHRPKKHHKKKKKGEKPGPYDGPAEKGDDKDFRKSLVGNASAWTGLQFDKGEESGPGPWAAEGFKTRGSSAGAGSNLSGIVRPFEGF